jgi:hypothetical protein
MGARTRTAKASQAGRRKAPPRAQRNGTGTPQTSGTWTPPAVLIGVVALVVVLGVIGLGMGKSAERPAGQNGVPPANLVGETNGVASRFCQNGELIPKDTATIAMSLSAMNGPGPRVRVVASRGGKVITSGVTPSGWIGNQVRVPVRPVDQAVDGVRLCVSTAAGSPVQLRGLPKGAALLDTDAPATRDRIHVEYLRPGSESWWAYLPTIVHRMGLGRAWGGAWIAFLILVLMVATIGIAFGRAIWEQTRGPPKEAPTPEPTAGGVRGALKRVPTTAWLCVVVAVLNAVTWSILSPPFQVVDERDHFAYVQQLAETGDLPTGNSFAVSPEEALALRDLKFQEHVFGNSVGVWSTLEQRNLERALDAGPSRVGNGNAGTAATQPPLYYALEAIPYRLGINASFLQRLAIMRLLSALLAGFTALFVYLFVREALPRVPWAWTVAGLATALQPLLGYVSGGVNPDGLLFASSAALFYCLARAFRRGLTPRLAVAIGAAVAVGLLSKLIFVALIPGTVLALGILGVRKAGWKLPALKLPAIAAAAAVIPLALQALLNALVWDPAASTSRASSGFLSAAVNPAAGTIFDQLNYMWQWYLPRIPGTADVFPGVWSTRDWWIDYATGRFGYGAIAHPNWVHDIAFYAAIIAAGLAIRTLVRARDELRRRVLELAAYGLMAAGLLVGISSTSYAASATLGPLFITQPRYFWPLAALMAAVIALVVRGGGRRWGPVIGMLFVVAVIGQNFSSQLLVISKWYG